jgi:hypothetical protein
MARSLVRVDYRDGPRSAGNLPGMGLRRRIGAQIDDLREMTNDLAEALTDRSTLGQLLIAAGFLCSLLAVMIAITPAKFFFVRLDATPVAVISVGMLIVGGILKSDFVGAAERATRRGVDTGEFRSGVYIAEGVTGDLRIYYPEGYNPARGPRRVPGADRWRPVRLGSRGALGDRCHAYVRAVLRPGQLDAEEYGHPGRAPS